MVWTDEETSSLEDSEDESWDKSGEAGDKELAEQLKVLAQIEEEENEGEE